MKLTLPVGSVEDLGAGVVRVTLPGAASDPNTPTTDQKAALDGAYNPLTAENPVASILDISLTAILGTSNDAGAEPITNLGDPTDDQDAATKKWVVDNPPGLQAVITKSPIAEGTILTNVDSSGTDELAADGTRVITYGSGRITFGADNSLLIEQVGTGPDQRIQVTAAGAVIISTADAALTVTYAVDGTFEVNGSAVKLNLPTSNPGPGILWADSGVVTVGS